tara:strand:- start:2220 stop:2876 length:657 start_codon:yes stop_codon:yes gene_type:complete
LVDRIQKYVIFVVLTEENNMPNWCNNSIKIYGPKDKVKKLVEGAEEGQFLDTLMPMPLELTDTVAGPDAETKAEQDARDKLKAEHGAENWYDWRTHNWSTKWDVDVYENSIKIKPDGMNAKVTFGFDSAWAPPIGAVADYLDRNDDMQITLCYYEPGCDFMGIWEDFDDRCYNCSEDAGTSDSDFWETEDGKILDDEFGIVDNLYHYEQERNAEVHGA